MNPITKFNHRDIVDKMEFIEKMLNDDLKKGLFEPEKLLYQSEIKSQLVQLFIEHWKESFGDTIILFRGTKYGNRTKKERRVDIWKPYPLTISPMISYKFAQMKSPISVNEKQIPIIIEYEFDIDDLKDKVNSVPFHYINVGSGFFGLEKSEMEFTFKEKPVCLKKNYYKPLIGFRFRKIETSEMKENKNKKMITDFRIFENINQKPVEVGRYLYHRSDIKNRESIKENGLFPKTGDRRLGVDKYKTDAIFATDSSNKKNWFDSTFDDDCWRIDTTKISNVIWYKDYNMGCDNSHPHVMTLQPIPPEALELIYEGTGRDTLFERLTPKSEVQEEIDRLIDRGLENLTPEELSFLKNPVIKKKKPQLQSQSTNEINKYYKIAEDFFSRVVGRDIRNFELNDKLDLWDIFDTEDEVYHAGNSIYYAYGVQIDPENDNDYILLNIFKKIYHRIQK